MPELKWEFDIWEDKKYKVEIIKDSVVYTKAIEGQLSGIYYLVFWKGYSKDKFP